MIISSRIKRNKKSKLSLMNEMNVVPMIDIMLVLLVIFMITAPLMTVGVKVNLPTANAPNIPGNEAPVIVHVNNEGRVFIGEVEISIDTLPNKLLAITKENTSEVKIFVRGDQSLSYGTIMGIMGHISSAGFKKVVLVTELPKMQDRKKNAAKQR